MDAYVTSRLRDSALDATLSRHERLMAEARHIIDAGNVVHVGLLFYIL